MFENRMLGRIFEPNGVEVIGDWRKLHNEELNDLYFYFWWGNLGKRDSLGRPRRRWEDNIKMDL
jgi:hypothetical protein